MKNRRRHSLLLVFFDTISVLIVFNVAGWLRGIAGPERWIVTPLVGPLIIIIIAIYLIDGYRSRTEMMGADYTSQHVVALIAALFVTLLLTYVVIPDGFSLQGSRLVLASAFVVLAGLTLTYRRSIHRWEKSEGSDRIVLFVGDRPSGLSFTEICRVNGLEQRVVCAITGEPTESPIDLGGSAESMRSYGEILQEIRSGVLRVEAIVLRESAHSLPDNLIEELTQLFFQGVPTYTMELFFETYWRKILSLIHI